MDLKLYDTLAREKRPFVPLDPANVRMYVCGPTVYDFAHIGNARPAIVFDVLFRLLRHLYGADHVTYVRNITDVDDKINARAAQEYPGLPLNEAIRTVTTKTEAQYHEDVDALGCLRPTHEPRATEFIGEMKEIIERLIAGGYAYVAKEHVLFSVRIPFAPNYLIKGNAYRATQPGPFCVPTMPGYGSLSNRSLNDMIAGARVEIAPYKRDPMDFVLWKPSKPGEPAWPSPAGISTPGRPGWHIECSAMSGALLGETFDIHGGGIDLVFPHHENEIAQSRCAFHTGVMANYWMHNGFLQVEGEKMSKSLGNFVTIRELLARRPNNPWWGEILRLNMLRTHYRQPIDWTERNLIETEIIYEHLKHGVINGSKASARVSAVVIDALSDDLNSHAAISELVALTKRARSTLPQDNPADAADELVGSLLLLGFDKALAHVKNDRGVHADVLRAIIEVEAKSAGIDVAKVNGLIDARAVARKVKNFAESDRIRDELAAMGIVIKDSKDGTTWEVKR